MHYKEVDKVDALQGGRQCGYIKRREKRWMHYKEANKVLALQGGRHGGCITTK